MPIPLDFDLPIFVYATAKVIFGSKARLRKNSRPIPVHFDIEEVPEEQLTPAQREYLKPFDTQLVALNYRPVCTFRIKNFGFNLLRRYSNPVDTASCALTIVEVKVDVNGTQHVKNSCSAAFSTHFLEGKRLDSSNGSLKSLFDQPPYRIFQKFPNVTNLAELKEKHDKRAARLGVPSPPPQNASGIFEEIQVEHERYARYQVECGNYRMSPDGSAYLLTDKVFERGIRNHFLPFGRRISLTYTLFTALVGAFLPLLGILKLAPWIAGSSHQALFLFVEASFVAIAVCYGLAGAIMGFLCDSQKFPWIMLVTYVPAHWIAGWTFGWFPYSTLCFVLCTKVAQARRRRGLVLQT
jgi:hypothetical protein